MRRFGEEVKEVLEDTYSDLIEIDRGYEDIFQTLKVIMETSFRAK